jgi:hypothetical protein
MTAHALTLDVGAVALFVNMDALFPITSGCSIARTLEGMKDTAKETGERREQEEAEAEAPAEIRGADGTKIDGEAARSTGDPFPDRQVVAATLHAIVRPPGSRSVYGPLGK